MLPLLLTKVVQPLPKLLLPPVAGASSNRLSLNSNLGSSLSRHSLSSSSLGARLSSSLSNHSSSLGASNPADNKVGASKLVASSSSGVAREDRPLSSSSGETSRTRLSRGSREICKNSSRWRK